MQIHKTKHITGEEEEKAGGNRERKRYDAGQILWDPVNTPTGEDRQESPH